MSPAEDQGSSAGAGAAAGNWMARQPRMLHLDYHQPPWMQDIAVAIDAAEAARQAAMFKAAGVEAVEIFAYDHHGQCYYPSAVGIVHPGLAADYTGLMGEALKEAGLRVILYLNVFTSVHLHAQHPDWFVTNQDGSQPNGAWLSYPASHVCASSPYLGAYFLPLLGEAIRRHRPDAVWLDAGSWLIDAPCWCDHCARLFRERTGRALPGRAPAALDELEDEGWVAWRLWRRGQIGTCIRALVAAAKAADPAVLVADNCLGRFSVCVPEFPDGRPGRWVSAAELGVDYLSCDPVPMGGNHELIISAEGRYQATSGLPYSYMNERFNAWGEWQVRAATDWRLEIATVVANGGAPFFADQPYPQGTLEPAIYRQLGPIYQEVAQLAAYTRGARLLPDVAILASSASAHLGPPGGVEWGRQTFSNSRAVSSANTDRTARVRGAHLSAVECGIQALLYDEATLRRQLGEQTAVVVADQCLLEDETVAALHRYVREGGTLLLTGRSGLWDAGGRRRDVDPFAELLGLERPAQLPAPLHFLRLDAAWGGAADLPEVPIQLWGAASRVRLAGARALGHLLEPRAEAWRDGIRDRDHWQHWTVSGTAPPSGTVAGVGIATHEYGAGRALYMSVDPFALYYSEAQHLVGQLLALLFEEIAPAPARRLVVTKPRQVEAVLAESGGRILVHLLNYAAQKRSGLLVNNEEIPPVFDLAVEVRLASRPARALLVPGDAALGFEHEGGRVRVRIPRLDTHALVVIESQA